MRVQPDFESFRAAYDSGAAQVVWTTFIADLETPVSVMLKLGVGRPDSILFESVEGGAVRGRYSIIGIKPDLIWRCRGDNAEINRQALAARDRFSPCAGGALDSLRAVIAESRIDLPAALPPMAAGLVGYMSYDSVRLMEKLPDDNPDTLGLPDGIFLRPTIMAIFDNVEDTITLVTPLRPGDGGDAAAGAAYGAAQARLAEAVAALEGSIAHPRIKHGNDAADFPQAVSNIGREQYHAMVERAKAYILAGDIFQVVPSQRFSLPFRLPSFALYRSLRRLNPSPFLFHLNFGDFSVVGSSPEILVRLRGDTVTVRPLAGTRPRGADAAEDQALAEDLLKDPKERAEHLMLLDLGRNDVGRVCRVGTLRVTERDIIERYSHVMHIVSNVEGRIAPGYDALDALIAGFPAGTVSGAPKLRAMEIIDALEPTRRGIYGGAVGYFSANGAMDTCIALRTAVIKDGMMYVQAGGGVVADSDPEAEYRESCNKARALIHAAGEAVRYGGGGGD